jgi:hypothetical protein
VSMSSISPMLSISFMVRFIPLVFFIHLIYLKHKFHLCNVYVNHMSYFIRSGHFQWYQFDQIGNFNPYGKVIHVIFFIIIIITFTISIHMVWCHPSNEFHSHAKLISSMSSSWIEFHYSSRPNFNFIHIFNIVKIQFQLCVNFIHTICSIRSSIPYHPSLHLVNLTSVECFNYIIIFIQLMNVIKLIEFYRRYYIKEFHWDIGSSWMCKFWHI